MKIYVVESGEYSDHSYHAIYESEAKANAYCAKYNLEHGIGYGSAWVSMWETSDDDLDDGTVVEIDPVRVYIFSFERNGKLIESDSPVIARSMVWDAVDRTYNGVYRYVIEDRDDMTIEKARKIAQDRHAHWKAEQEGIAS